MDVNHLNVRNAIMAEQADARRMQLMELLAGHEEPQTLEALAAAMRCDQRTIRRDIDSLQQLFHSINGLELRRGKVQVARVGYSPGYFTNQLDRRTVAKRAIATHVVKSLADDQAIALTAGSTPYAVACEIRRAAVEAEPPHNLIVFTNSIPSLLEMVAAGISTGVLGEIYSPEDCALHTSEFRSAFQPSLAIVGASGVLLGTGPGAGLLDLFSHRAEEAAFLKQVLNVAPEVIITVDSTKLGRRHPWNFGGAALHGKRVKLVTEALTEEQKDQLNALKDRLQAYGTEMSYTEASMEMLLSDHAVVRDTD
jgi:DeoR/GlpR family transcriptional regulator of sugar metabolism